MAYLGQLSREVVYRNILLHLEEHYTSSQLPISFFEHPIFFALDSIQTFEGTPDIEYHMQDDLLVSVCPKALIQAKIFAKP